MHRLVLLGTLALVTGCAATAPAVSARPPAAAVACSSDLACSRGREWCAKPFGASTGTCIQVVDEHGLPAYAPPRQSSSWIGGPGCLWSRSCPFGFWCDQGYCVR